LGGKINLLGWLYGFILIKKELHYPHRLSERSYHKRKWEPKPGS